MCPSNGHCPGYQWSSWVSKLPSRAEISQIRKATRRKLKKVRWKKHSAYVGVGGASFSTPQGESVRKKLREFWEA